MLKNLVILGAQWGDEGKGKIVDSFVDGAKAVIRYNGGSNAGHTIYNNGKKIVTHLVPTGFLSPSTKLIITSGVVVSLASLAEEIKHIEDTGIDIMSRLYISENCALICPFHSILDGFNVSLQKKGSIGTTGKGIGPISSDKYFRRAIKLYELRHIETFSEKFSHIYDYYSKVLAMYDTSLPDMSEMLDEIYRDYEILASKITNVDDMVFEMADRDEKMIFEGAQGSLLDIEYGAYPYVTSSHTTIGGVLVGTGLSHKNIGKVYAVAKAYTTRVGNGAFPTELKDEIGDFLRNKGNEFGSTTGRPRRCGWLDLVALKYSVRMSGVDELIITKLDILSGLPKIRAGVSYTYDGHLVKNWLNNDTMLERVQVGYETFDGFDADVAKCRKFEDLPIEARRFLEFVEDFTATKIGMVSVGVGKDDLIMR